MKGRQRTQAFVPDLLRSIYGGQHKRAKERGYLDLHRWFQAILAAFGPWSAAASPYGGALRQPWWAPAHVLTAVSEVVERIDAESTYALLDAWDTQSDSATVALLRGFAVTGRRACPPPYLLLEESYLGGLATSDPDIASRINDVLCCLTAMLCERARFSAQQVREFAAPLTDEIGRAHV